MLRNVNTDCRNIVSGAILNNTLESQLSRASFITPSLLDTLSSSTYGLDELGFSKPEIDVVLTSYMSGLKYIFILYEASSGVNFLLSSFVRNTNLKAPKDQGQRSGDSVDRVETTA
jgi:hypothetical protein